MANDPIRRYIAPAPKHFFQNGFERGRELRGLASRFFQILKFSLLPFQFEVAPPEDPPNPDPITLDETTVARCEKMFEEVEATREQLELKARATFTVIAFLTPLLISAIVYLLQLNDAEARGLAWAYVPSALVLVLAFTSVTRAGNVRPRLKLFLAQFLDPKAHAFLPRDDARYAQGLLLCAGTNVTSNDHISQLVKGGQILTALAVVLFVTAAIPTAMHLKPAAPKTEIAKPIEVIDTATSELARAIQQLSQEVSRLEANVSKAEAADALRVRVEALEKIERDRSARVRSSRSPAKHPKSSS